MDPNRIRATLDFQRRHPNWRQEMEQNRQDVLAGRGISLEEMLKILEKRRRVRHRK